MKNANVVQNLFESYITPAMQGFKLRIINNSFIYTRKEAETVQQIEFVPQISTEDGKIIYFRIYPRINVYFKKVNDMARTIFDSCLTEACIENSINNSTYCVPVDMAYKKGRRKRGAANMTSADCSDEAKRVQSIVSEKALPLLDNLKTTDDFIACWENHVIMYPHRFAVYIICAYLLKGNTEKAKKTAEEYFKKINNISEYEAITQYIKNNRFQSQL